MISSSKPKVAALFSGGGTQHIGMGKTFYDRYDYVRETFELAGDTLGIDMVKMCFEGDLRELSFMENAQPATLLVSYIGYQVLTREFDLNVDFGVGHSLGEYTALTCAEALSLKDALLLIRKRGELLQKVGIKINGSMMAINRLSAPQIYSLKSNNKDLQVFVAVLNSKFQTVVSGDRLSLQQFKNIVELAGGEANLLNINTSSHCMLMIDAAKEFEESLKSTTFHQPVWPVFSNLDAKIYKGADLIPDVLIQNFTKPVLWQKCIENMENEGVQHWIDVGPMAVSKNLLPFILSKSDHSFYALDIGKDREKLIETFNFNIIDFANKCLTIAVSTPNYASDYSNEEFKESVVNPYDDIKRIKQTYVPGQKVQDSDIYNVIENLKKILVNKRVPEDEMQKKLAGLEISHQMAFQI